MDKNYKDIIEINPTRESFYDPSRDAVVGWGTGPFPMILEVVKKGYIDLTRNEFVPPQVIVGKYASSEQARMMKEKS